MSRLPTRPKRITDLANRHRWVWPIVLSVLSLTLVAAALASEYIGGQAPCKLCYIQRFPHMVTGISALTAWHFRRDDVNYALLLGVCLVACGFGSALSAFHTGGELGLWDLSSACEVIMIQDSQAQPVPFFAAEAGTDCARSAWRLFGLPMAGFNVMASLSLGLGSTLWLWILRPRLDLA